MVTSRATDTSSAPAIRELRAFLLVAFAWSWGAWFARGTVASGDAAAEVLGVIGRAGPSLAALLVAWHVSGRAGVASLTGGLRRWRVGARPWCIALLGPPLVILTAVAAAAALGAAPGSFNDPRTAYLIVPAFVTILVLGGPLGEELGWRGFALDRLQALLGPVTATLLLGLVWGLWHLPLFLDPSDVQHAVPLPLYLGQTTATAFVYTWLWNRTRSLPLVLGLHASTNTAAGVFPLLVPDAGSHLAFTIAVVLAGCIALWLTWTTHGRLGYDPVHREQVAR